MPKPIRAIITSCLPSGCWASPIDSPRDIWIPRNEIFWHHTLQDTWDVLMPGQQVSLAFLKRDEKGRECWSYREVNSNPWIAPALPQVGDIIETEITHIEKSGVYALAASGSEGWLPASQIVDWRNPRNRDVHPADLFWLGDKVRVAVRHVAATKYTMLLSMEPVFVTERRTLFPPHIVNTLHLMLARRDSRVIAKT